jgi:hypothetical protein
MNYKIIGVYKGKKETIDNAETPEEARYLVGEYQLAFGNQWRVYHLQRKTFKLEVKK